jgi:hypothetical protein
MYSSGSSRQFIAADLVSGEGFAVVPRRGRCVDDFVTLRRQRSERLTFDDWLEARDDRSEQRNSALRLTWYRRKASKINDAERSLPILLARCFLAVGANVAMQQAVS